MLGASFLLAMVIMGIVALSAFGVLSQKVGSYIALGFFIIGVLGLSRVFGPALLRRKRGPTESGAAARSEDG
jgi:hypothetical protein